MVERSRQRALNSLGILENKNELPDDPSVPTSVKKSRHDDAAFSKLVEKSKALFGVGFSAVNLIDGDFVVFMDAVGNPPEMAEGCPRDGQLYTFTSLCIRY